MIIYLSNIYYLQTKKVNSKLEILTIGVISLS